ncbi:MAG: Pycsar system effector family protein [Bacteroidota bacterium]
MHITTNILEEAEHFVKNYLKQNLPKEYVYHTLEHTLDMVKFAKLISGKENLSESQQEVVLLAGWFHDLGYAEGCTDHEQRSIQILEEFAKKHQIDHDLVEKAKACIEATKMPQNPQSIEEAVICDADMFHLATDQFLEKSELLRKEFNNTSDNQLSELDWLKENKRFLGEHKFFTDHGKNVLEKLKSANLEKVETLRKKKKKQHKKAQKLEENVRGSLDKISELKKLKPDRGIETMFRLTSKNHLDLSAMADNKANIMISINSIILSVVVSVLIRKVEESTYLLVPTLILTLVCLSTIVLAILSTIPNISEGKFTKEDIKDRKTNLLFFGNFHKMPLKDYEWGMKEMMGDGEYLYGSLIKDIYFLGAVLGKKYRLLRISYTIFMFGFVGAILSFIIAYAVK